VYETGVYSSRVGPKGPALERFPDIKNKKKNNVYIVSISKPPIDLKMLKFF
jgi:hypothetical protein